MMAIRRTLSNIAHLLRKGWSILVRRLRTQGAATTLLWLYARGLPFLTGVPLLRYSRVTPQLYVGPQFRRLGMRLLLREGIHAAVSLRGEFNDADHGLALPQYLHLPTVDDEAVSFAHLDLGTAFIRRVISSGGKVYIHCGAGVGRAPTLAAAYLMTEGHSLDESLAMIRRVRPFITITPPQMDQLRNYELLARAAREKSS